MQTPKDFANVPYEAVSSWMAARSQSHPDSFTQFAAACNAVKYKFLSCTEHSEAFTKAIEEAGTPGLTLQTEGSWYTQQRELFGFFMMGLSTIESLCYGLFAVGSVLNAQRFPIATPSDLRKIKVSSTTSRFVEVFPNEAITSTLQQLTVSQEFKDWVDIRRVLFHRGLPSRIIRLSFTLEGGEPEYGGTQWGQGVWGQGISIDENTTASRQEWLASTIHDLLTAADTFVSSRP